MAVQRFLDQLRINIVTAADNQILGAAGQTQKPLFIKITKVTSIEPVVFYPGFAVIGLILVAGKNLRTFDQYHTGLAGSTFLYNTRAIQSDDTDKRVGYTNAYTAWRLPFRRAADQGSGFGHSIAVKNLDVKLLLKTILECS